MIKKTITYTDYDGVERTEDFYFNLSPAEITEMEMGTEGGLQKMIDQIIQTKDSKKIIELFKDIILRSYGEKSADGRRFQKRRDGHALAEDFAETEAYSVLFMELATDADAAAKFISGVVPGGNDITPEKAKEIAAEHGLKIVEPAKVEDVAELK